MLVEIQLFYALVENEIHCYASVKTHEILRKIMYNSINDTNLKVNTDSNTTFFENSIYKHFKSCREIYTRLFSNINLFPIDIELQSSCKSNNNTPVSINSSVWLECVWVLAWVCLISS